MPYLFMNQDVPWLEFSCVRDEFDEVTAVEERGYTHLRPLGYRSLTGFLERRRAPKHRAHVDQLLLEYGCQSLDGYLDVAHALSLNDTFWVKSVRSSLTWDQVSLYRNPFNAVISHTAFDGTLSSPTLSSTSPEFSTDGQYAKCWVREGDSIQLYKTGGFFGLEPISEYLAGQLAARLCPEAVSYDLDMYRGQLICKCSLFTDEGHGFAKAAALFPEEHTLSALLRRFEDMGSGDAFRRMCVLDGLILNTDRHMGNFGVLFDTETLEIQKKAPVFDHNRSLLFDRDADQLRDMDFCLRHCVPRLGTDFIATARGMLTPDIRRDLEALRGFQFAQHPALPIAQDRLDGLNAIVQHQLERILA